jgi:hypothetical protein
LNKYHDAGIELDNNNNNEMIFNCRGQLIDYGSKPNPNPRHTTTRITMAAAQSNNNHESDDVLKLYALARLCAECH